MMQTYMPYMYPGALHIHTTYSDGTGTISEIAAAAREAGLRWIIVTDHDTLKGKPEEGWYDDVCVLVGHEITPLDSHYLALNVDQVVSRVLPTQKYIDQVYTQGGFGIIAHPDDHLEDKSKGVHPWDDWSIAGPSEHEGHTGGLEIWNVMSDWRSKRTPENRTVLITEPQQALTGPTPAVLAWWDRLNLEGRRTFAIGGLDVHATKERLGSEPVIVFPYLWMFGTLTNYVLLDAPLSNDIAQARSQIYQALRQGRSYFVNRLDGTPPALPFRATCGDQHAYPGDTLELSAGTITLYAMGDTTSELRLIHNGEVLISVSEELEYRIEQPGVYRLEGYRSKRAWLYTNPIYVVA